MIDGGWGSFKVCDGGDEGGRKHKDGGLGSKRGGGEEGVGVWGGNRKRGGKGVGCLNRGR